MNLFFVDFYLFRKVGLHSFFKQNNWPTNMWYTVGANEKDYDELEIILSNLNIKEAKINISVDVAHGDTLHLSNVYKKYRNLKYTANLMSGTVATAESARNVYDSGCTHIRVGIGPGSACSTRIVTGCGVPNFVAVFNIYNEFCVNIDKPVIIADGGIKIAAI